MIVTDRPVDVAALRREWIVVVDRSPHVSDKTRRVARRTCFANIAKDIQRYGRYVYTSLFKELFEDVELAEGLAFRLWLNGPEAAASWLEKQLGVELVNGEE